jgi:hypothetical protein
MQRRGEVTLGYVLEWLGQQKGSPFFVWFHLWTPTTRTIPRTVSQPISNAPYNGELPTWTMLSVSCLTICVARSA